MKKIIVLCSVLFFISGCNKKNVEIDYSNEEQVDFVCTIDYNSIFDCDNVMLTYDEYNNIKSVVSKNGTSEYYNYTYNSKNLVSSITKENGEQLFITYDEKNNVNNITYVMDPSVDEDKKTIITYKFSYNNSNKLNQIIKAYNNTNNSDIITYEYYTDNKVEFVKEIKTINNKKITRVFKSNEIIFLKNAFTLVNFFPDEYYKNLSYYPYYNYLDINYGKITDTPIFVPIIDKIENTNFNGENLKTIKYYLDSKNRFITDSENNIIHGFDETKTGKLIRTTIYIENYDDLSFETHYKYKTEYIIKDNKIVKFIKYQRQEILEDEYNNLKEKFLKDIETKK